MRGKQIRQMRRKPHEEGSALRILMRWRSGVALLFCVITALSLSWKLAEAASDIYVRMDGHDTLCDGTADAPYPGSGGPYPCAKQTVQAGVDAVDPAGTVHIRLGFFAGGITISKDLTLQGAGTDFTIINGGDSMPGLDIDSSATVNVHDLIIQNGLNTAYGGGIHNEGTLLLEDCVVRDSSAPMGGGVYSNGMLTIHRCRIELNEATSMFGGGLYVQGSLTMADSTVHENIVDAWDALGGGMKIESGVGEAVVIRRTTISGNSAIRGGGMISGGGGAYISADELAYLANVTIADNISNSTGGGIVVTGVAGVYFQNSTIADNHSPASTTGGVLTYSEARFSNTIVAGNDAFQCGQNFGGMNLTVIRNLSSDASCNFTFKGDMQNTDPLLGPLQDNGGHTETMAVQDGSPAIDAGGNSICTFIYVDSMDQRGWTRPIDGDLNGTATCDIGAFEMTIDMFLPLIMR